MIYIHTYIHVTRLEMDTKMFGRRMCRVTKQQKGAIMTSGVHEMVQLVMIVNFKMGFVQA
jgi:hypothetical protein